MANNITVKDASASSQTVKTTESGSPDGVHTPHQNIDAVIPGTGATNLGKAEDAAHTSADTGVMALAVRKATAANVSDTDGDYEPLQVSGGHAWVALPPTTVPTQATFTRPADTTAYAASDAIANSASADSVSILSWAVPRSAARLVRATISGTALLTHGVVRLWLFSSNNFMSFSPTAIAPDNVAFTAPLVNCLGYVDVAVSSIGSDVAIGWANCDIPIVAGTVYGLLQAITGYTPTASETYRVDLTLVPG